MLNNISNLGSVLNKSEQKTINGGNLNPECPIPNHHLGCYSGPFYCDNGGLPTCPSPEPHTH